MFKLISCKNKARRGKYTTIHGVIETPVFMNVATQAAIKGALSSDDLKEVNCQVALANTYHLHIRPGDELIARQGGLHNFMQWDKPILTDSGGFQIFSLASLRKVTEEGVAFNSHVDGRKIFMSPEDSIRIQKNLGSDIIMTFDECVEIPSPRKYVEESCDRTYNWLVRCKEEMNRGGGSIGSCSGFFARNGSCRPTLTKNPEHDPIDPPVSTSSLFGINQGATFADLRIAHMKRIAELDLPGYAIGGLAVGEPTEQMYDTIDVVEEYMPQDKPRYLMGVGTPQNIIEGVARGVDFFDCVMPARNGRHGKLYTWSGEGFININNEQYKEDSNPIDSSCSCPVCTKFSRAYIRHLFKAGEMLAMRLAVLHNLYYYNTLMEKIRSSLDNGTFETLRKELSR